MKRLIDDEHRPGSPEHILANLVRATPHLEAPPLQKQRILVGVKRATSETRRGRLTTIATTFAVLAGAALAAAAVGHFSAANSPRPMPLASTAVAATPALSPPAPAPPPPVASAQDPAPVDIPTAVASAPLERPSTRLRATVPFKDGEDPAPVLEAIRALRYNGDPARASVLLAQYLKAHPRGVLAEDASALSIEAAIARHDTRAASELGRRYLAQFPGGRYRAFAAQAAQPTAP
jgi:hypothetical protein